MSLAAELVLPKDYGFILLTATGTFILSVWHGIRVGGFRKKAGIKYPKHYADSGDIEAAGSPEKKEAINLFNCAQRAHGNFNDNHPSTAIALLASGLAYPRLAALMGVGWIVGRVIFAVGYTNPKKPNGTGRLTGAFFWLFQFGLFGLTAWSGVQLLL